jgi:hypothetical protein
MPQRGLTPARGGRNAIKCCIHGDPTILETSRRVERECIQPAAVAGRGVKGRGATGFALRVAACILSLSLYTHTNTHMHAYVHTFTHTGADRACSRRHRTPQHRTDQSCM